MSEDNQAAVPRLPNEPWTGQDSNLPTRSNRDRRTGRNAEFSESTRRAHLFSGAATVSANVELLHHGRPKSPMADLAIAIEISESGIAVGATPFGLFEICEPGAPPGGFRLGVGKVVHLYRVPSHRRRTITVTTRFARRVSWLPESPMADLAIARPPPEQRRSLDSTPYAMLRA